MPIDQNGDQVPFPPVPNVIKLSMRFQTAQDLDIVTNTHWKYSGSPPVSADLQAFLTEVATSFTSRLNGLIGTAVTHVQDTVTDLSSSTGNQQIQTHAQVGTRTGGMLPISTAAVFIGKIQRRYRGGKPRNYWPLGTDGDLQDTAHWTTAALTAFNNGVGGFTADLAATFGAMTVQGICNVSYYQGHYPIQDGVTKRWRNVPTLGPAPAYPKTDLLTGYNCNQTLGSQRRRLHPG